MTALTRAQPRQLEVGTRVAGLDERVPGVRVDGRRHAGRGRRSGVDHDPDDRAQFGDPQGERSPHEDRPEGERHDDHDHDQPDEGGSVAVVGSGTSAGSTRPRDDADERREGGRDDGADGHRSDGAETEGSLPAPQEHRQGARLEVRGDGDADRQSRQPERADEIVARVVFTTTAPIAARTGVSVSCRA